MRAVPRMLAGEELIDEFKCFVAFEAVTRAEPDGKVMDIAGLPAPSAQEGYVE